MYLVIEMDQLFQLQPFGIHGWVHIPVQGDLDIGVPQDLAETFDVNALLHAICRKRVAQYMEVSFVDLGFPQYPFELVLHRPWLQRSLRAEDIGLVAADPVQHFQDRAGYRMIRLEQSLFGSLSSRSVFAVSSDRSALVMRCTVWFMVSVIFEESISDHFRAQISPSLSPRHSAMEVAILYLSVFV